MTKYPIEFDIKPLFKAAGVKSAPKPGTVFLNERMEVPEKNPNDEWIYLGLEAMGKLKREGFNPEIVCDTGTGNGILAIGMACIFRPKLICLTDIVEDVLKASLQNLQSNLSAMRDYSPQIIIKDGRDAEPLLENTFDLIAFSPSPIMVKSKKKLDESLARTTLTDYDYYSTFAKGKSDPLLKWSVLPWHVFLSDAKKKLRDNGIILGLYSGRMPFWVIQEAYDRAGLTLEAPLSIVKKQQGPAYLKEYAEYEKKHLSKDTFDFYVYSKAKELMQERNLKMPGLTYLPDVELKEILKPAKISAKEAFLQAKAGLPVAHVGHALIGRLPKT